MNTTSAGLWFIIGLVVFKIPPIKKMFSKLFNIVDVIFLFSILGLAFKAGVVEIMNLIVTSIGSYFAYLIGANLSRWDHFGLELTPQMIVRIVLYIIIYLLIVQIF